MTSYIYKIYCNTLLSGESKEMKAIKNWRIMQAIVKYILDNREAIIWLVALIALAAMNTEQQHASICPLSLMDLGFCPGCGLGHSIAYLFRGELLLSFQSHPLGVFALVMLSYRIISLSYRNYKLK